MRLLQAPIFALAVLHLILLDTVKAGTTTKAERSHYETRLGSTPPRFADYHALLDWYYAQSALGHTPTRDELRRELKDTMTYRLSKPQVYYEGTGYIPGVDEGWRPDVSEGEYRKVRETRDEEIRRVQREEQERVGESPEKEEKSRR